MLFCSSFNANDRWSTIIKLNDPMDLAVNSGSQYLRQVILKRKEFTFAYLLDYFIPASFHLIVDHRFMAID